jgi:hypothetical protein
MKTLRTNKKYTLENGMIFIPLEYIYDDVAKGEIRYGKNFTQKETEISAVYDEGETEWYVTLPGLERYKVLNEEKASKRLQIFTGGKYITDSGDKAVIERRLDDTFSGKIITKDNDLIQNSWDRFGISLDSFDDNIVSYLSEKEWTENDSDLVERENNKLPGNIIIFVPGEISKEQAAWIHHDEHDT